MDDSRTRNLLCDPIRGLSPLFCVAQAGYLTGSWIADRTTSLAARTRAANNHSHGVKTVRPGGGIGRHRGFKIR